MTQNNQFTEEEIKTAKEARRVIIEEDVPEIKSVYMAGEIVMWGEMKDEAMKFAEWILKNATPETRQGQDGWNYFRRSKYMNTKQLYDIFRYEG